MGEIKPIFHGFKFYVNSDDHYPPHVHVVDTNNSKNRSRLRIDNGEYLKGEKDLGHGSSKIKKYIRTEIQQKCIEEWNRLNPDYPYKEGIKE